MQIFTIPELITTVYATFLSRNETNNFIYLNKKNCFIDYEDYKETVFIMMESFISKAKEGRVYLKHGEVTLRHSFKNKAIDNLRKLQISSSGLVYKDNIELIQTIEQTGYVQQEYSDISSKWIFLLENSNLSEDERNLLVLKLSEGKTNKELAIQFGISTKTVAKRLAEAEQKLRNKIQQDDYD